jgi:UDP-N-acetylenolpyruvoylglucosamine reductase
MISGKVDGEAELESVTCVDRQSRETMVLTKGECRFDYRTSRFKEEPDRYVIVHARLGLVPSRVSRGWVSTILPVSHLPRRPPPCQHLVRHPVAPNH